ncbi:MAG: sigma-70 family RNA polymerase sigma factor [Chloroflexi bacterium]|nr:sigma-70 family RNA polymerase sigma factor [Chloroflexota bacterium]
MDEADLIEASQRGDLTAFNRLALHYQELVYNLTYRMLGDAEAAADATQDTFLSAFQNIKRLRGASLRSWVLRIATNACYDQLRRRQRRPSASLESLQEMHALPERGDSSTTPEEHVLHRELQGYIQSGLAQLPADQRLALILSDIHGLNYAEIAQVTDSPLGTVKSRLSRGRAHLRDYLLTCSELLPSRFRL